MTEFERTQENLAEKGINPNNNANSNKVNTISAIQQLQLKTSDEEDKKQINNLLSNILGYPNSQFAQLHGQANRLGNRDQQIAGNSQAKMKQLASSATYCPCCGYVKQQYELKLCQPLDDISNLGLSTFLYFQTIKNLAIILVEMLLIYGIYSFATNLVASGKFSQCGKTISYADCSSNVDYIAISLASKQTNITKQNETFYYVQTWIGLGMVIVWFITFAAIKYYEKLKQIEVDTETKSGSDFTLVVQNLPQNFTQAQFQEQLKKYEQKIKNIPNIPANKKKPLVIAKYNKGKPFYLNQSQFDDKELKKLQQEQLQMRQKFVQWILQRQNNHSFTTTKQKRQQVYKNYEQNLKAQQKKLTQLGQKVKQKLKETNSEHNTIFFVTLDSNLARILVTNLNQRDFSTRIRNLITCNSNANKFQITRDGRVLDVKIQRAPQPEDVVWANIGLTDCQKLKRKFITFSVTVIILGISFAAVYGLSKAQLSSQNNRFLSILISLVISLINIIISQAIRYLSIYERDYTTIKYQTSLAVKSILAQLINSILIPMFANYYIKSNIYSKNGLADDIFMLGLTNAFVTPIMKYFDLYYFYLKILICYYNRPNKKVYLTQPQLNAILTNMQFEVGYQYIYVVNLYLFVCFFVSLQPIICLFALLGYFLMFWTQKWSLFNRMRRPVPGNDLINTAMSQIIFLGPIVYSLGSLTWSNFFPEGTPKYAIVSNLICLGVSVLMFVFPLSVIFSKCFEDTLQPEMKYQDNRIFLATQYDRLNPATAQEGFKDYMSYVEKFGQKMKGKSKQQQAKMQNIFMKNAQKGNRQTGPQNMAFGPPGPMNFFSPPPMSPYNPFMMTQQMPIMPPMFQPTVFAPQVVQPQIPVYQPQQQQNFNMQSNINNQGFRPPQQNPPPAFGFGNTPQPPIQQFGMQPSGFGQPNGFGFGQPSGFGGFGQQSGFGFGQPMGFGQPFNPFNNGW